MAQQKGEVSTACSEFECQSEKVSLSGPDCRDSTPIQSNVSTVMVYYVIDSIQSAYIV